MNKRTKYAYEDSVKCILALRAGRPRSEMIDEIIRCERELEWVRSDLATIGKDTSKARALLDAMRRAYITAR